MEGTNLRDVWNRSVPRHPNSLVEPAITTGQCQACFVFYCSRVPPGSHLNRQTITQRPCASGLVERTRSPVATNRLSLKMAP